MPSNSKKRVSKSVRKSRQRRTSKTKGERISEIKQHEIKEKHIESKTEEKLTDKQFWDILKTTSLARFERKCKYLLHEFGTTNRCNRFDVGNCIEFFLADWMKSGKLEVVNEPNALRTDILVKNYGNISVKYTSSGGVKLHNSLGKNKDMYMYTTLILRPKRMYLISYDLMDSIGVNLDEYLQNTGDGLNLKSSIFTRLNKLNYYYRKDIDIYVDKSKCKHRMCAELVAKYIDEHVK